MIQMLDLCHQQERPDFWLWPGPDLTITVNQEASHQMEGLSITLALKLICKLTSKINLNNKSTISNEWKLCTSQGTYSL